MIAFPIIFVVVFKFQQIGLIQDVATRWNSTLMMVRRLLLVLPAVISALFGTDNQHLCPDVNQTKHLQDLQELLEPFERATKIMSSEKKPTASMILPTLRRFLEGDCHVRADDSTLIRKAKEAISTDLKKRYTTEREQDLLYTTTVLDPRFKNLVWVEDHLREKIYSSVKQLCLALAQAQVRPNPPLPVKVELSENQPALPQVPQLPASPSTSPQHKKVQIEEEDFFDVIFIKAEKGPQVMSPSEAVEVEFERYLAEPPISSSSGDPFAWWQGRKGAFPILHELCLRYLQIPGTSVPSERVFSTAGHILNKKRASLNSENADMLIFLSHNYKA